MIIHFYQILHAPGFVHVDTFLRYFLPYRIVTMMNGGRERMGEGEGKFCTLHLRTKILVNTEFIMEKDITSLGTELCLGIALEEVGNEGR